MQAVLAQHHEALPVPGGVRTGLALLCETVVTTGGGTIATYVLVYGFGLLIGQDVWQRVFTARSPASATAGGVAAAIYCGVFAVAGALVGTAARALYPELSDPEHAFATVVALNPGDKPAAVIARRCRALRDAPPPDWDGVVDLD